MPGLPRGVVRVPRGGHGRGGGAPGLPRVDRARRGGSRLAAGAAGAANTTSTDKEAGMRKLIAAMKTSVDGKIEAGGTADWVQAWSEDYGLTPQIDACLLGGGMYPGYEQYWTG